MQRHVPTVSAPSPGYRWVAVLFAAMLALIAVATTVLQDTAAAPAADIGSRVAMRQSTGATPVAPEPVSVCETTAPGVGSEPWVRSELYFGTTLPDGTAISPEQWQAFLDEEITPRFPAGLTVLEGYGQFLNSQGVIAAEDSIVLIIFHPYDGIEESSAALEDIRDIYEEQFDQESVLRVDAEPVCISF